MGVDEGVSERATTTSTNSRRTKAENKLSGGSYYYILGSRESELTMLPATKKYIQIPSHDYIKMKSLLLDLSEEFKRKERIRNRYCPSDINLPDGLSRYEERYIQINKLLSELELHSRVVEDY